LLLKKFRLSLAPSLLVPQDELDCSLIPRGFVAEAAGWKRCSSDGQPSAFNSSEIVESRLLTVLLFFNQNMQLGIRATDRIKIYHTCLAGQTRVKNANLDFPRSEN